jgi:hypothetical protein
VQVKQLLQVTNALQQQKAGSETKACRLLCTAQLQLWRHSCDWLNSKQTHVWPRGA